MSELASPQGFVEAWETAMMTEATKYDNPPFRNPWGWRNGGVGVWT
ncbi:MAG: hypothetical protein IJK87_12800 [Prevotella sp.]|nr:hypothetical protein [Prevotella sp.]